MFSKTLETSVVINAPAGKVWSVVGALEHYAGWNRATLFNRAAIPGQFRLMRVRLGILWLPVPVLIRQCDAQQGLRWTGGIPGLITGSHYFRVESQGKNQARLVQGEDFAGLLVPVLLPWLGSTLDALYTGYNADAKAYCET